MLHDRSPKIVIVEDDPDIRTLLRTMLPLKGYEPRLWQVGTDPVLLIQQAQPDMVILDVRIRSSEDGWAVLERLQEDPATARIPVLVCSADVMALQHRAVELRARGYAALAKPFVFTDLFAALTLLLAPARISES